MFGRGKERAPTIPQKDFVQDVTDVVVEAHAINAQAFARLPEYLIKRFGILFNLTAEYKTLTSTMGSLKLPSGQNEIYIERISRIVDQLTGLRRIADAIRLGYEPYEMPADFYIGKVNRQKYSDTFKITNEFKVPMSEEVLAKYERARKDGSFDMILAGSSDKILFYNISSLLDSKYVLVGFVPTGDGPVSYGEIRVNGDYGETMPGLKAPNVTGFLIADLDIKKPNLAIAS